MNRSIKVICLSLFMAIGLLSANAADPVLVQMDQAKWGPAPPALPAGAQSAVLSGDPMTDSPFTVLVKFPANYSVAAHSHPKNENVTIISGTLYMGMGDKLDHSAGTGLSTGGYALMPANMNHYVYTKVETVFTIHGQGPVEFKYVNPADDPRSKK
ncbi:cupin domain-containing protein [bacterium]|nr:cupin domain-containing protein [bacterium]MCI0602925.1 cupin domain-containing protein [bacterium]